MYFYNLFSPCLIYLYYNKSAKVLWFTVGLVVVEVSVVGWWIWQWWWLVGEEEESE